MKEQEDSSMFLGQNAMREVVGNAPDVATQLLLKAILSRVIGYWVRPENLPALMKNPVDVHAIAKALLPFLSDHETLRRVISGDISKFEDFPGF